MLKKCLSVALACSFLTSPVKTEKPNGSYLQRSWNYFKKKINTITQHGNETYMGTFCIGSMVSAATGLKLWLDRNDMIEHALRDANGNIISNSAELFDWVQKIRANGADVAKIILGAGFKENEYVSTTGESFTWKAATKLEPVTSTLEYKIMLGTVGIIGLAALYSAYELFNTPDEVADVTAENLKEDSCA